MSFRSPRLGWIAIGFALGSLAPGPGTVVAETPEDRDPDFTVSSTGVLTLHAGNRVILADGFSVQSGGSLTVVVGGL